MPLIMSRQLPPRRAQNSAEKSSAARVAAPRVPQFEHWSGIGAAARVRFGRGKKGFACTPSDSASHPRDALPGAFAHALCGERRAPRSAAARARAPCAPAASAAHGVGTASRPAVSAFPPRPAGASRAGRGRPRHGVAVARQRQYLVNRRALAQQGDQGPTVRAHRTRTRPRAASRASRRERPCQTR